MRYLFIHLIKAANIPFKNTPIRGIWKRYTRGHYQKPGKPLHINPLHPIG